jgi:hypothetical protein
MAQARRFQEENPDYPMTWAVVDHLIARLEESLKAQAWDTAVQNLRNLKEVMAEPEPQERVSGRVQIVTVETSQEAQELCPWACRFQPVGNLPHQQGKWICFETDDDADAYRRLSS